MPSFSENKASILTVISVFSLIAFTIGGMALVHLFYIRSHAERLIHENLPQWAIAHEIDGNVARIGYFMLGYSCNLDPGWWDEALLAMDHGRKAMEKGRKLAAQKNLPDFQRLLLRMESTLEGYHEALMALRAAGESILGNRDVVRRSSRMFIQNVQAYLDMQEEDLTRQLKAVFSGSPLIRGGLDLATETEISIRRQRLHTGARILDAGRTFYETLLQAAVQRENPDIPPLQDQTRRLRESLGGLIGVTRQSANLQQLQTAMDALEAMGKAMENLVMARKSAEQAHQAHKAAYTRLLSLAREISTHAHDSALYGGNRTRAIAENFVKILIPLALAGFWALLMLHARIGALERQTREMSLLSALAENLRKAEDPSQAVTCVIATCKKLFPSDSGTLSVLDEDRRPMATQAWGARPPDLPSPFPPETPVSGHGRPPVFYLPVLPPEGLQAILALRLRPASILPGQKQAARKALARSVADHLTAGLTTLHLMQRLKKESVTDALTGLYNRRYMEDTLRREFARCTREGLCLSLLLIDIDHFKKVNDTHGHAVGDRVLIHLGGLMRRDVRTEDVVCRIGGEEFLILMPGLCPEAGIQRAERLRIQAMETPVPLPGKAPVRITISIGLAVYPQNADTPDILIRVADEALYAAKAAGRNRVCRAEDRSSCIL